MAVLPSNKFSGTFTFCYCYCCSVMMVYCLVSSSLPPPSHTRNVWTHTSSLSWPPLCGCVCSCSRPFSQWPQALTSVTCHTEGPACSSTQSPFMAYSYKVVWNQNTTANVAGWSAKWPLLLCLTRTLVAWWYVKPVSCGDWKSSLWLEQTLHMVHTVVQMPEVWNLGLRASVGHFWCKRSFHGFKASAYGLLETCFAFAKVDALCFGALMALHRVTTVPQFSVAAVSCAQCFTADARERLLKAVWYPSLGHFCVSTAVVPACKPLCWARHG